MEDCLPLENIQSTIIHFDMSLSPYLMVIFWKGYHEFLWSSIPGLSHSHHWWHSRGRRKQNKALLILQFKTVPRVEAGLLKPLKSSYNLKLEMTLQLLLSSPSALIKGLEKLALYPVGLWNKNKEIFSVYFNFFFILLEHSWPTVLYSFQMYSKVNRSYL